MTRKPRHDDSRNAAKAICLPEVGLKSDIIALDMFVKDCSWKR